MFLLLSFHKWKKNCYYFSLLVIDLPNLMTWTVLLQKMPCLNVIARNLKRSLSLFPSFLASFLHVTPFIPAQVMQELCLAAAPSLPLYGYGRSFMTRCLQHPWRYIVAASICPFSSPENNEANNFFNYLSRAASSVNKFISLSPGGLAFYFIRFFFHIHLKHVLLFILIPTASFFSYFSVYHQFYAIILLYSVSFLLLLLFIFKKCLMFYETQDLTFN